jgi:hypothetical protein
MPNIEYAASWVDETAFAASMPHAIWETLSPHGRRIAARVKAAPGVWPAGAGAMHPLASGRAAAKASAPA